MENTLYFGVVLMAVGMTTVFIILALVVLGGKLTLIITNRSVQSTIPASVQPAQGGGFDSQKVAVITAAVHSVTQGRGKVVEISKKN